MDVKNNFPCKECGAQLQFKPGTDALNCPYCGAITKIEIDLNVEIKENDFDAELVKLENKSDTIERIVVDCGACGAETSFPENIVSSACPFCGAKIVAQGKSKKSIKPQAILPFKIEKKEARDNFKKWIGKRWFLPNKARQFTTSDGLAGVYSPYWTYDSDTVTKYRGERGEYYYETEEYEAEENGQTITKTREVRHTEWYSSSGIVYNKFDDLAVVASKNIPESLADALQPWDFNNLVTYNDDFLSGFDVESYTVNLKEGFVKAKNKMQPGINQSIRMDIGGDEQRILSKYTDYENITFKHILLPIWISSFRYNNKVYQYLVNGRTGKVYGKRPWSIIKIILFVLFWGGALSGVIFLINYLSK